MRSSYRVLVAAILLLSLGGLGGSFQPSRLVLLAFLALPLATLIARPTLASRADHAAVACLLFMATLGALSLTWTLDLVAGLARMAVVLTGMTAAVYVAAAPKTLLVARHVRDAWGMALALTLPLAAYELATGNHFAFALDDRAVGGEFGDLPFASTFFGNFNDYCTFISLALPMAIGSLESARHRAARGVWTLTVALSVVVLAVNLSRLALIFVAWLMVYYAWTRKFWRKPVATFGALATIGLILGAFEEDAQSLLMFAALKFGSLAAGDESTGERLALLNAGVQSLTLSAGMGLGVGGFEAFLRERYSNLIPNPHNLLMELAANFGALSAVAFVGLLAYLYVSARKGSLPRDLRSVVLVSLPFVPAIGAISSQAIGYTYWWLWLGSIVMIVGTGQERGCRTVADARADRSQARSEPLGK